MRPFGVFFSIVLFFIYLPLFLESLAVAEDQPPQDYAAAIDELLPALAAADLAQRTAAQRSFEDLCLMAAQPGQDQQRARLCRAIKGRLGNDTPDRARMWFLRQLERIGGVEVVPALQALLDDRDERIRDGARRALQENPSDDAAAALRSAVDSAADSAWREALLNALAARRVSPLQRVAVDARRFAKSAPAALDAIMLAVEADQHALKQLQTRLTAAWPRVPPALQEAVVDAWLRCADAWRQRDRSDRAGAIYRTLYDLDTNAAWRLAALRGRVQTEQIGALQTLLTIVTDTDETGRMRRAAAALLVEIPGPLATLAIEQQLMGVTPEAQTLLLAALADRADAAGLPAVLQLAEDENDAVRLAALRGLGALGDHRVALRLARKAAQTRGVEAETARDSLARLRGEQVDATLRAAVESAEPPLRCELIRVLAARYDRAATGLMLEQALDRNADIQMAAFAALETLAEPKHLQSLIGLVLRVDEEDARNAAVDAVVATGRRADHADPAAAVLDLWPRKIARAQPALAQVLGQLGGDKALAHLRELVRSGDRDTVDAAVRALAGWETLAALEDLHDLAAGAERKSHRVLALRGYIRLLGLPSEREPAESLRLYSEARDLAERVEEKRLVLAGIGAVRHPDALALAQRLLDEPELRGEAEVAVIAAARSVSPLQRQRAEAAIREVMETTARDATRTAGEKALAYVRSLDGYLTAWRIAGPYFKAGETWEHAFDTAFAPETDADVAWQPLPVRNEREPWIFELSYLGGGDRAVYVRTSIWSPRAQPLRLDVGSDDGVVAWVNGEMVHRYRGTRGLNPFEDRVPLNLREGWNTIMLKVVQVGGGWAFAARLQTPDGAPPRGLKYALTPAGRSPDSDDH